MNWVQNNFMKPHRSADFFLGSATRLGSRFIHPENDQTSAINEKKIGEVWSKHNFDKTKVQEDTIVLANVKTWGVKGDTSPHKVDDVIEEVSKNEDCSIEPNKLLDVEDDGAQAASHSTEETSPSHHARRPPNAFLIFCKKHRPVVRQRYPTTENRGVTKILGEWWALLLPSEKQPYNDLAKEYKDAFLSANPDFRWYKLPAPPLRTLATRPVIVATKPPPACTVSGPPPQSPPALFSEEFTPGKLADESQLGGLTSLMNNNDFSALKTIEEDGPCCEVEDNNNEGPALYRSDKMQEKIEAMFSSPTCLAKPANLPPKPIKKRIFEQYVDEKNCSKNIFEEEKNDADNITQQDLLDRVVDGIFAQEKDEPKEQRKSDRVCKGKLYERFMVEGKLLGNKRDVTKLTQHHRSSRMESHVRQELNASRACREHSLKFNLENTIKRLAERTNVKIDYDEGLKPKVERPRTTSETSEPSRCPPKSPAPPPTGFNLDLRIECLGGLCYDDFVRRKRETKKRKLKIRSDGFKCQRVENDGVATPFTTGVAAPAAVGSKKRKNKSSITRLHNKPDEERTEAEADALLGLATLAMVAASTEKIGEGVDA